MNNLITGNSYHTARRQSTRLVKLLNYSYFYFFLRLCINYYFLGRCAKQGRFDSRMQIYYCDKNIAIMESFGVKFHIENLDSLKQIDRPCVIVGNHMSSVETAILNSIISPHFDFTYVIKNSLFNVPFLGRAMKAINAIGVNRDNPKADFKTILEQGKKRLENGQSVLIFPESTRQDSFKAERFNSIGTKLAAHANVKIIPFALKTDLMTPGLFSSEFGPLHKDKNLYLEFGEPMQVTGNGKIQHQKIIDFIAAKTAEWTILSPEIRTK